MTDDARDLRILYLEGDSCSPKYVAGALRAAGLEPESVVGEPLDRSADGFDLYLLSDYEAESLGGAHMREVARAVEDGAGLMMVGGWTSFGRGGYAGTALEDVLPVRLEDGDDRENHPSGLFLEPAAPDHPLVRGLAFRPPPVITGRNRVTPRDDASVVLEARAVEDAGAEGLRLADEPVPIVVTSRHGRGRVTAIATDLAPHWSGGWTDWGERAIDVGQGEELGDAYLEFVTRLCRWTAGREATTDAAARARAR